MKSGFWFFGLALLGRLVFAEGPVTGTVEQVRAYIAGQTLDKTAPGWKTRLPPPPRVQYPAGETLVWTLETSKGNLRVRLRPDIAPVNVANIVYLSELGFYDGLFFHRIIPGFMAQGGCPLGKGYGSPGYTVPLEVDRRLLHQKRGVLSMARRPDSVDSASSQFFILFGPAPGLDMQYTVFGELIDGAAVVDALEAAGNPAQNGMFPREKITILRTKVTATSDAAP